MALLAEVVLHELSPFPRFYTFHRGSNILSESFEYNLCNEQETMYIQYSIDKIMSVLNACLQSIQSKNKILLFH
jgi:hypothetical protein